jgi:hypothetical protein
LAAGEVVPEDRSEPSRIASLESIGRLAGLEHHEGSSGEVFVLGGIEILGKDLQFLLLLLSLVHQFPELRVQSLPVLGFSNKLACFRHFFKHKLSNLCPLLTHLNVYFFDLLLDGLVIKEVEGRGLTEFADFEGPQFLLHMHFLMILQLREVHV